MIKLNEVILRLYPNVEWTLNGDTLDGLYFNDQTITKPTKAQIDSAIAEIEAEKAQAETKRTSKSKTYCIGFNLRGLRVFGFRSLTRLA